jgi:hypothetical protein
MALQTFTAGQVLTAAQVNALQANDFNQTVSTKTADYVLVAADKGTRVVMNSGSATTITVDTDLFNAGDTLWIQNIGAGVCTITAGTATVATAGSLELAQNAGGTLYFTSTGVSIFFPTVAASSTAAVDTVLSSGTFTAQSAVNLSSVLSSSYNFYTLNIYANGSIANTLMNLRYRENTTDFTGSNYSYAAQYFQSGGSMANASSSGGASAITLATLGTGARSIANINLARISAT